MENKLTSTTDFVINEFVPSIESDFESLYKFHKKVAAYAEFLKQPLTLGMFVPCDENDKLLYPPIERLQYGGGYAMSETEIEEYKKAQGKILFKGFELIGFIDNTAASSTWIFKYKNHERYSIEHSFKGYRLNIESLISRFRDNYELTESALKKIGLL